MSSFIKRFPFPLLAHVGPMAVWGSVGCCYFSIKPCRVDDYEVAIKLQSSTSDGWALRYFILTTLAHRTTYLTNIIMDENRESLMQINFDIMLYDLPCSLLALDHPPGILWANMGSLWSMFTLRKCLAVVPNSLPGEVHLSAARPC